VLGGDEHRYAPRCSLRFPREICCGASTKGTASAISTLWCTGSSSGGTLSLTADLRVTSRMRAVVCPDNRVLRVFVLRIRLLPPLPLTFPFSLTPLFSLPLSPVLLRHLPLRALERPARLPLLEQHFGSG
jgi:hypothetical protein